MDANEDPHAAPGSFLSRQIGPGNAAQGELAGRNPSSTTATTTAPGTTPGMPGPGPLIPADNLTTGDGCRSAPCTAAAGSLDGWGGQDFRGDGNTGMRTLNRGRGLSIATSTQSSASAEPQAGAAGGLESVGLASRRLDELEYTTTRPDHAMTNPPTPVTTPGTFATTPTTFASPACHSRYPGYSVSISPQRSRDLIAHSDHTVRGQVGGGLTTDPASSSSQASPSVRSVPITPRQKSVSRHPSPQSSSTTASNLEATSSQGSNVSYSNDPATSPPSASFSHQSPPSSSFHFVHLSRPGSSEPEPASSSGEPRTPPRGTVMLPNAKAVNQSLQVNYNRQITRDGPSARAHYPYHLNPPTSATGHVPTEPGSGAFTETGDAADGQAVQHTVMFGEGPCLACLAAREEGREDGGFYGPNVPLEDQQPWRIPSPTT